MLPSVVLACVMLICQLFLLLALPGQMRPDMMESYIAKRDSCDWKTLENPEIRVGMGNVTTDELNVETCIVDEVELEEGIGFYKIYRFGPILIKGDEMISIYLTKPDTSQGMWRKGFVGGAIDPHTEKFFSFPPLYIHHVITVPGQVDQSLTNFSLLGLSSKVKYGSASPRLATDQLCSEQDGGSNCLFRMELPGYAEWVNNGPSGTTNFALKDARVAGSPEMSYIFEHAELFLPKLHDASPPLKKVHDMILFATDDVYERDKNMSSYITRSIYFPTDTEMKGTLAHAHWAAGDEIWVVRGTQDDIGIPKVHQSPIQLSKWNSFHYSKMISIADTETLTLKRCFNQNIRSAAAKHNARVNRGKPHVNMNNSATQKLRWKVYNSSDIPPSRPEILCVFKAQVDTYTSDVIELKRDGVKRLYSNSSNIKSLSSRNPETPKWNIPMSHRMKAGWTNPMQQSTRMYQGVSPGDYYRVPLSSSKSNKFSSSINHCDDMRFAAGDILTIVGFNVAQSEAAKETLFQHTALRASVHLPFY